MAGYPMGALPPASPSSSHDAAAERPASHLVRTGTRTRRNHGAFTLGGQLACVYSTRRAGQAHGVCVELGAGTLTLAGQMTPAQARTMAKALTAAAAAAEALGAGGAA